MSLMATIPHEGGLGNLSTCRKCGEPITLIHWTKGETKKLGYFDAYGRPDVWENARWAVTHRDLPPNYKCRGTISNV